MAHEVILVQAEDKHPLQCQFVVDRIQKLDPSASLKHTEPLHTPHLSMHRSPCLMLPSLGKLLLRCPLLPVAFHDPLAILYGSLLPGTLP